jgi:GNAT superfamily N-acetyltransferase
MTDAELTARLRANILDFKALQAHSGPLWMLELPGVRAFSLPGRPDNLFQQQVLYEDARALAEALPSVEAWYREQCVPDWRVPVLPWDSAVEAVLSRAGYQFEDITPAMGLTLAHPPPLLPAGLTLERPDDLDEVMALNELSYGAEYVSYFRSWSVTPLPSPHLHAVLVRERGRALAGGVSFERGDTAGIYLVATHPEARRRGLGALVMQGLHADAYARGRAVAVLQASPMGHSLYRQLGYRELGAWRSWVHRAR